MSNMSKTFLCLMLFVVGCGEPDWRVECVDANDSLYCEDQGGWVSKKAFDEDHDLVDTTKERVVPRDQLQFDYEMYKTWDRMTKHVFDYREMTWEQTDGELDPKCYDKLPNVKFVEDGCWEGVAGCYYWSKEKERYQIRVLKSSIRSCADKVYILYHEFTHITLLCSYEDGSHNEEYFYTDEYYEKVYDLQAEIC